MATWVTLMATARRLVYVVPRRYIVPALVSFDHQPYSVPIKSERWLDRRNESIAWAKTAARTTTGVFMPEEGSFDD